MGVWLPVSPKVFLVLCNRLAAVIFAVIMATWQWEAKGFLQTCKPEILRVWLLLKLLHRIVLTLLCHKLPVAKAQVKGESMVNQVQFALAGISWNHWEAYPTYPHISWWQKSQMLDVGRLHCGSIWSFPCPTFMPAAVNMRPMLGVCYRREPYSIILDA